jgi:hypothetical protein
MFEAFATVTILSFVMTGMYKLMLSWMLNELGSTDHKLSVPNVRLRSSK